MLSTQQRLYDAWDQFNEYAVRTKREQIQWLLRQACVFDSRFHSKQHIVEFTSDILANAGVLGVNLVALPADQQSYKLHDGWEQFIKNIATPSTSITEKDPRIHFLLAIILNKGPGFQNESEKEELDFVTDCLMSI